MKKNLLISLSAIALMALAVPMVSYAEGDNTLQTQATQSTRWHEQGGTWFLSNENGVGNVINSWFQDLDGSWYVLAPSDGHMYAGLIHDNLTGKDYFLQTSHDGFYGRMATVDGAYTVNGQTVYLTFNQSHNGTFGSLTSGTQSLTNTGVPVTTVESMPTDSSNTIPVIASNTKLPDDRELVAEPDIPKSGGYLSEEEMRNMLGIGLDEDLLAGGVRSSGGAYGSLE